MVISNISPADWSFFEKNHGAAYHYLLRCSLLGEWENLLSITPNQRTAWQQKRCDELTAAFEVKITLEA